MNVCVIGHGHFASIVAAVVASRGYHVVQHDEVPYLIRTNQIALDREPGYMDLARSMRAVGRLTVSDDILPVAGVYWIAYDVPIDDDGSPLISEVRRRVITLDARVPTCIPFLVSCQWPVCTLGLLEDYCPKRQFVYVMENVRAGKAVMDFQQQLSLVIGTRHPLTSQPVLELLRALAPEFLMMTPESAEFSKHALNAFIALQIAFVNELRDIAADVSVDMADVSRALLSDPRVSPSAPLRAGSPFGGGSLKRDLKVLQRLGKEYGLNTPILSAILRSNER